jgi:Transglycosylase SLT domain/Peptidase family M23
VHRRTAGGATPQQVLADGTPTPEQPGYVLSLPGAAPVGVSDFVIDSFRIPPFLLPIYQAAGTEYGIRWEILAAINEIETDYGRDLRVSAAGAMGWMQFMPSTWRLFAVDANGDGIKDPDNPFDAIFTAARYLSAAGAATDISKAVFAYNHADWYVKSVLMRARLIGGLPADLVGPLTGLTAGRFPVLAKATYAASLQRRETSAAARLEGPSTQPRRIRIFTRAGAAVVAVHDARISASGRTATRGRFVSLQDVYGNRFTYGNLAGSDPSLGLRPGMRVSGGTVIGYVARPTGVTAPHLLFEIRPAGRGAPRIDPKPILDGWKLLESTAIYRAAGENPFFGSDADAPSIGQILLMSKESLAQRVLNNPRIQIYDCGRRDIQTGQIDRRVLATLEFLAASGFKPTVSALKCGHSLMTTSGNISEHSTGNAVDIAAINGIPILGHQGKGSITELTIQRLLTLQGTMKPHQIISLMTFDGADNTLSLPDHADHIHVGFHALYGTTVEQVDAILKPKQWIKLIDRLGEIDNPTVRRGTSPRYPTAGGH